MPKVPERPLSYGEILNSFRTVHKSKVNQRNVKKFKQPRRPKRQPKGDYSYGEVMRMLKRLGNEEL